MVSASVKSFLSFGPPRFGLLFGDQRGEKLVLASVKNFLLFWSAW